MIVLIDPVSTGKDLSAAFVERGEVPVHLWVSPALAPAAQLDPHPEKLVVASVAEAIELLAGLGVRAVIAGSEWGVEPANAINHAFGLPHHEYGLGAARRNKADMYAALEAAGVPSGFSRLVVSLDALDEVVEAVPNWPVVVKPVDSAGGDACRVCWDGLDVRAAVAAGLGHTNLIGTENTAMVVQAFLDGPQYIVNTVSLGGRHLLSDMHAVRIDQVNGRPVMRHSRLLTSLGTDERALVDYTLRCLDALGVIEGAAHSEVRMTAGGPRLVEVNARIMGACLDAALFGPALGATQADLVAERYLAPAAFAKRFDQEYAPLASAAIVCLFVPEPGTVRERPGLEWMRGLPGYHSSERLPAVGASIDEPWLCTGRAGMAYFLDPCADELERTLTLLHDHEDRGDLYRLELAA